MADLQSVAYLDSNVFIEAIEGEDIVSMPIQRLFDAARNRRGALVTSELALAEVLGPQGRQSRPGDLKRLYLNLMVWGGFIELRPVSRDILYETAELRRFAPLKLPDAIHLATAIETRCAFFVTRDHDFKRLPTWMRKIEPDAGDLDHVMRALE